MNNQLAVATNNLSKSFDGVEVVKACSMNVEKGSIYGFIGRNGAGKTTVFKMLLGLMRPTGGSVSVLGMDSVRDNTKILRNTGSLIETPVFYEHLSAKENLRIHLAYMGITNGNGEIEKVLDMVGISNTGDKPVSAFSLGMRQRLGIARAMVHRPEVMILDEPVNGLDPIGMKDMRELFLYLTRNRGCTILLSSHILAEIGHVADRIGFIVDGRIINEASPDEIIGQYGDLEDYFVRINGGGASRWED